MTRLGTRILIPVLLALAGSARAQFPGDNPTPRELWRYRFDEVREPPLEAIGDPRSGALWVLQAAGDEPARLVKIDSAGSPARMLTIDAAAAPLRPVPLGAPIRYPVALAPLRDALLIFHTAPDGSLRARLVDEAGLRPPRESAVDEPAGPVTGARAAADADGAWLIGVRDGRRIAVRYDARGAVRFRLRLAGEQCKDRADLAPLDAAADADGVWLLSKSACGAPGVRVERVLASGREAAAERIAVPGGWLAAADGGARLLADTDPARLLSLPGGALRAIDRPVQSAADSDARLRFSALAGGPRALFAAGVRDAQPWLGALDERGLLAWESQLPVGPVEGRPALVSAGPRLYLLIPLRLQGPSGEPEPALEIRAYAAE